MERIAGVTNAAFDKTYTVKDLSAGMIFAVTFYLMCRDLLSEKVNLV